MQKRKVKYKHNRYLYTYLTRAFTHTSIQSAANTHALRSSVDKADKNKLSNQREQSKYAVLYGKRFINTEYSIRGGLVQTNFLQTIKQLERRLDTLVYKAGFTHTITAAKQMVNHRYVSVNNTIVTLPGMKLQPGDVIHMRISHQSSEQSSEQRCAHSSKYIADRELPSDYVRTPALEVDGVTGTAIYVFHPQQAEYLLP